MAQIARTEADKATNTAKNATDNVAELSKRTTVKTAEVTRETAGQAENVAQGSLQSLRQAVDAAAEVERKTVRRAGEGMAEVSQVLVDLVNEQTRHNIQLFHALTQTVDWGQATQLQSEVLRTSLKRTAQFTRRYFEVSQAVMNAAVASAQHQAKKAA